MLRVHVMPTVDLIEAGRGLDWISAEPRLRKKVTSMTNANARRSDKE
jgi:hypothetical protein